MKTICPKKKKLSLEKVIANVNFGHNNVEKNPIPALEFHSEFDAEKDNFLFGLVSDNGWMERIHH